MMKFHISCSSLSLTKFSDALETVYGEFDGWQIVAEGRHGLGMIGDEFRDIAGSYSLEYTVHAPFSDINLASLNKSIRLASVTEIAECMRRGAELGIRKFVAHPGHHSVLSSNDRERAFLVARESIKSLNALAESLGVELYMENMTGPKAIGSTVREMKLLLGGTSVGICLDFSHALLEKQLQPFLEEEASIGMLHISDNDGVSDTHAAIGSGMLEPARIIPFAGETGLPLVVEALSVQQGVLGKEVLTSHL